MVVSNNTIHMVDMSSLLYVYFKSIMAKNKQTITDTKETPALDNSWIENALLNKVHISVSWICRSEIVSKMYSGLSKVTDFGTPSEILLFFKILVLSFFVVSKIMFKSCSIQITVFTHCEQTTTCMLCDIKCFQVCIYNFESNERYMNVSIILYFNKHD